MAKKQYTASEARARMEELCSMAEFSSGEAMQKLRAMGLTSAEAIAITQGLIDSRFIDDERFARAYVRTKINISRWGRIKVRQSLAQKGVERPVIEQALEEEVDLDVYHSNLADALRAKARAMPERLDSDCRARLLRFAAQRGYEPGLIMEMLPEEEFWRHDPQDD